MIKIYSGGARIEYTRGDTFLISVAPEDGDSFPEGSTLELIIAKETLKDSPVIDNAYELSDGKFTVELKQRDTEIAYGEYVYKMILKTVEGAVLTQKDGKFEVIWGA